MKWYIEQSLKITDVSMRVHNLRSESHIDHRVEHHNIQTAAMTRTPMSEISCLVIVSAS